MLRIGAQNVQCTTKSYIQTIVFINGKLERGGSCFIAQFTNSIFHQNMHSCLSCKEMAWANSNLQHYNCFLTWWSRIWGLPLKIVLMRMVLVGLMRLGEPIWWRPISPQSRSEAVGALALTKQSRPLRQTDADAVCSCFEHILLYSSLLAQFRTTSILQRMAHCIILNIHRTFNSQLIDHLKAHWNEGGSIKTNEMALFGTHERQRWIIPEYW